MNDKLFSFNGHKSSKQVRRYKNVPVSMHTLKNLPHFALTTNIYVSPYRTVTESPFSNFLSYLCFMSSSFLCAK